MLGFLPLQLIENSTRIILRKHQQQIKIRISQDSWSRQSEPGGRMGAGRELRFSSFSFILCLGYTLRTFFYLLHFAADFPFLVRRFLHNDPEMLLIFLTFFSKKNNILFLLLPPSRSSRVRLSATPETAAHQAPPSLGFSRQEHWSGLPFPSPMHESEK